MAENNFDTPQMNPAAPENNTAADDMNLSGGHLTAEDYGFTSAMVPDGNIPADPEISMNPGISDGTNAVNWSGIPDSSGMISSPYNSSMNSLWSDQPNSVSDRSASDNRSISVNLPNWPSFPMFPNCTGCTPSRNYAQVRFLNASSNSFPVNISIDNTAYAINSRFGTISNYDRITDGFHTISVRRASGLRTLLLQKTLPFTAGLKYTIVLVDTAAGGLNLVQVNDSGCNTLNPNTGCYRVANMTFSGSSFDVFLYSHDALFLGVDFQEVTPYKQAMAGSYQFYITNSNNFSVFRELPMIIIGAITGTTAGNEPLVSYQVDIAAGSRYTTYLLGNTWSNGNLRLLTVQD